MQRFDDYGYWLKKDIQKESNRIGAALLSYFVLSNALSLLGYWLFALAAGQTMGEYLSAGSQTTQILVEILAYTLSLVAGILILRGQPASFGKLRPKKPFLATAVPLFFAIFLVFILINLFSNMLFSLFGLTEVDTSRAFPQQTLDIVLYIIQVAVLPPILEELLFRGAILSRLRRFGDVFAVVVSGILFSALHMSLVNAPGFFFFGAMLALVTIYSGSLLPAIIIHALNNMNALFAGELFEYSERAYLLYFGAMIAAGVLALAVICIVFFAKPRDRRPNFVMTRAVASPARGLLSVMTIILLSICLIVAITYMEFTWL